MAERPLTDFVEEVCGTDHLRVEDDLGDGFVRLRSSEAERRQARHDIRSSEDIVIEMLRNSRDAHAKTIFIACTRKDDLRSILMIDDGDGVPLALHEKIFEPRVTSKLDTVHMDTWGIHGRGMALYSIAANTQRASLVASDKGLGAAILVESDTSILPEKTDQSSFPLVVISENNKLSFRGPRNIIRTISEFAFAHRKDCAVYFGSPAEIAATLYAHGARSLSTSERMFPDDIEHIPLVSRLCLTNDPAQLAEAAEKLGLAISERTARRILGGDITSLPSIYERIAQSLIEPVEEEQPKKPIKKSRDKKTKIADEDLLEFKQAVQEAYTELADKYYLESTSSIDVNIKGNTLGVTISLEPNN